MTKDIACPRCGGMISIPASRSPQGVHCGKCNLELPPLPATARGEAIDVRLSGPQVAIPKYCACCMGYADEQRRVTGQRAVPGGTQSRWIELFYCRECAAHMTKSTLRAVLGWLFAVIGAVAAGFGILVALPWTGFGGFAAVMIAAASLGWVGTRTVLAVRVCDDHGSEGAAVSMPCFDDQSTTLRFRNPIYAALVTLQNEGVSFTTVNAEVNPVLKAIGAAIIVGVPAGFAAWGIWEYQHITLWIDNGTNEAVEVSIADHPQGEVGAMNRVSVDVPSGSFDAVAQMNGATFEQVTLDLTQGGGVQIYNVGRVNCYVHQRCFYGDASRLPEVTVYHQQTLVDASDADYLFAPAEQTISVDQGTSSAVRCSLESVACHGERCHGECVPGMANTCTCTDWGQCGMGSCQDQ